MQLAFVFLFLLLALMWVLLISRQREARRQRALLAGLAVGDQVVTAGGIHGRVVDLEADTVMVEVAPALALRIARPAIISRLDQPAIVPGTAPGLDRPDPSSDLVVGTED